jgi:putative ABC transport system permease protein
MFKTYFMTVIRFFAKNKVVTLINIMGLAMGITCALLVFLFIQYELSVDQFHNKIDKLYRLLIVGESRDIDHVLEYRSDIIQERVRFLQKYPEITNVVRLLPWHGKIEHKKRWIRESRFWFADPHIFDMLTLPLKRGNPKTVLQIPNSVVITPAVAAKYFGEEDPIGKTLKLHMSLFPALYTFTVTGILESLPKASSIKIDFLAYIPFEKLTQDRREITGDTRQYVEVLTLVELVDQTAYQSLQEKVSDFYCHDVDKSMSLENMKYQLEPFKNAYLKSKATFWVSDFIPYFEDALVRKSDKRFLITLTVLGVIILVFSCINIINLAIAQANLRAKEIGTAKVVGAQRRQLIIQFITETVLMSYLALLLALILTELLLPSFNTLIKRELSFNYINNGVFLLGMVGIATFSGILSGIYPAFVLSSLKPATELKSLRLQSSTLLRKGLVITQIGMCVTFILFSLVMLDEMNVLKVKNVGFNSQNLIFFQVDDKDLVERYPAFKKEILRISGVTHMTASNFVPWKYGFTPSYAFYDDDTRVRAQTIFADSSFIETYQIPVVDGEGFSTKRAEMPGYVIINETARKVLQSTGTDSLFKVIDIPVGNALWQHHVLGIMQDFYYFYPSKRIKALAILPSYHVRFVRNFVTIRLAEGNHTDILAKIEKTVKRFFPRALFDYKYIAKEMEKMHTQKLGYRWIALVFITGFSLFIAAGGLFGFATYESERCTKEIGIRKALGAKPMQIAMHFILRFVKLTLIANVIAWPICYFIIQGILRVIDYPHPIQISLTYFLLAGLLTLVLTIVTVWVQTYRAALVDPVKALQYEQKE